MEKNVLQTPKMLERERLHKRVCSEFLNMRNEYPTAPKWRILTQLSRQFGLTATGIYYIVRRNNLTD